MKERPKYQSTYSRKFPYSIIKPKNIPHHDFFNRKHSNYLMSPLYSNKKINYFPLNHLYNYNLNIKNPEIRKYSFQNKQINNLTPQLYSVQPSPINLSHSIPTKNYFYPESISLRNEYSQFIQTKLDPKIQTYNRNFKYINNSHAQTNMLYFNNFMKNKCSDFSQQKHELYNYYSYFGSNKCKQQSFQNMQDFIPEISLKNQFYSKFNSHQNLNIVDNDSKKELDIVQSSTLRNTLEPLKNFEESRDSSKSYGTEEKHI